MTATNTRPRNARPASEQSSRPTNEEARAMAIAGDKVPRKLVLSDGTVWGYPEEAIVTEDVPNGAVYVRPARDVPSGQTYDILGTTESGDYILRLASTNDPQVVVSVVVDTDAVGKRKAPGTPSVATGADRRSKDGPAGGRDRSTAVGKADPTRAGGTDGGSGGGSGGGSKTATSRAPGRTGTGDGTAKRKSAERRSDGAPEKTPRSRGSGAPPGRPVADSSTPGDVRSGNGQPTSSATKPGPATRGRVTRGAVPSAGSEAALRASVRQRPPAVDTTPSKDGRVAKNGDRASMPRNAPKYVKGAGAPRKDQYRDTMARLFLWLNPDQLTRVRENIPKGHERTRSLLEKLAAGPGREDRGYVEFLLQEVDVGFSEKVIPLSGLADQYANYAFGANAPTVSCRAVLLNNRQDDQATNMFLLYTDVLRALQTAKTRVEVHLLYDQTLVTGTMVNYQWTLRAEDESACVCTFQIIARHVIQNYGITGDDPYEGWGTPGSDVPAQVLSSISVDTTDVAKAPWVYTAPVNLLPPKDTTGANVSMAATTP